MITANCKSHSCVPIHGLLCLAWMLGTAQNLPGATPPDYAWAVRAGGANLSNTETVGSCAAADANGNVFVGGLMSGPSYFGTNLAGPSGSSVFLAKYNTSGEVQWVRTIHTGSKLECGAVVVDSAGNAYITGAAELQHHGSGQSMFLRKYDPNGTLVWTNSAGPIWISVFSGPAGEARGHALSLDQNGNLYVAGSYMGQPAFGSSNVLFSGIFPHAGGGVLVTNRAGARPSDLYLAKYDIAGRFQWVRTAGGTNDDYAYGVSAASDGKVWLTGSFQRFANFENLQVSCTNDYLSDEAFVANYDANGTPLVVKAAFGSGEWRSGYGIAADSSGGAIVAGRFTSGFMGLGNHTITNSAGPFTDTFVARVDGSGSVSWLKHIARQIGGYGRDRTGIGLRLDNQGNILLAGSYNDKTVTFGSYQFAAPPPVGLFLAKYDTAGLFQWAMAAEGVRASGQEWTTGSGTSFFIGNNLASDNAGNLYWTGVFNSASNLFGAFSLTSHLDDFSNPGYDLFLTKLGTGGVAPQGPRLGLLQLLPGGNVQIQVSGTTSAVVIERSSNFNSWTSLSTNNVVNGAITFLDPLSGEPGAHFYRVYTP